MIKLKFKKKKPTKNWKKNFKILIRKKENQKNESDCFWKIRKMIIEKLSDNKEYLFFLFQKL